MARKSAASQGKASKLTALPSEVAASLGFYVYMLSDPRNGQPFYVGKGTGQRLVAHGREADLVEEGEEPEKTRRIREIRNVGLEPAIDIVRHGLRDKREALEVEGALIDCLPNLVNQIRGHGVERGRATVDELMSRYGAPLLRTSEPLLLVRLKPWTEEHDPITGRRGHGYRTGMSDQELYDSARAWWALNPKRIALDGVKYAVAVFAGVTRAIIAIDGWEEQRVDGDRAFKGRLIKTGQLWEEVVGSRGHRINFKKGAQGPVGYWPLKDAR